jgi:hypothetical protein
VKQTELRSHLEANQAIVTPPPANAFTQLMGGTAETMFDGPLGLGFPEGNLPNFP